jgi:two-component system alkaline phosphatase synthesis response regulator PhoP
MSRTVLVADDEPNLRSLLNSYLTQQGYRVVTARDGDEALAAARQDQPDVIVLDIMMPRMDGLEFIRRFRKEAQVPIILLTARVDESDKVVGLELGADDYVTKPFSPRELTARIGAMLRRAARSGSPNVLQGGGITLDRQSRLVLVDGHEVALTPTEFDLLAVLMSAPGRVFSRLDLLDITQGTRFEGIQRTVDVHIKNLRSKIEADPRHPARVQTIYGIGYRFTRD